MGVRSLGSLRLGGVGLRHAGELASAPVLLGLGTALPDSVQPGLGGVMRLDVAARRVGRRLDCCPAGQGDAGDGRRHECCCCDLGELHRG
jgi:hypothetical protein